MKKRIAVALAMVGALGLIVQPAQALPTTTSWTDGGMNEMVRVTGPLTTSISGAGFLDQTGTINVEKPTGGTVLSAYLTSASLVSANAPTDVKLNGQSVVFSHTAKVTEGWNFANYFADVTSLVKTDIDAAAAGTVPLTIDEGTELGSSSIDGEELVVIFNDPAKINTPTSVVISFGAARQAGDTFTLTFPALTDLTRQTATLSLGIGFSWQMDGIRGQQSNLKISTSSNTTLQWLSQTAGGHDDGVPTTGADGALITVGGNGDNKDLPALDPNANDDELYGLGSFLAAGDTSITIETANASRDDNVFQSVLIFDGVKIEGAESIGDPVDSTIPGDKPAEETPTEEETPTDTAVTEQELADTGSALPMFQLVFGLSAIAAGAGTLAVRRIRRR